MPIAEGDVSKFTNTFASNMTTMPTTVFNAAWSLPTVTGYPLTKPAVYGGLKGGYKIPFKSIWVYFGKKDIVHDWQYRGGTLDSKTPWTRTTMYPYYLDSYTGGRQRLSQHRPNRRSRRGRRRYSQGLGGGIAGPRSR